MTICNVIANSTFKSIYKLIELTTETKHSMIKPPQLRCKYCPLSRSKCKMKFYGPRSMNKDFNRLVGDLLSHSLSIKKIKKEEKFRV